MPEWCNGSHGRLKICCPRGRVGSTPTSGTKYQNYWRSTGAHTSGWDGSEPSSGTMLPWTADPLMTTGGDRLVNRLW